MATLTGYKQDRDGVYIDKDPEATLDYSLEWNEYLTAGNEITSATWSIGAITGDTDPLTVDSSTNTATRTTAVISGGTAGNIYTVTCAIVTEDATEDRRFFRIAVKNRSL